MGAGKDGGFTSCWRFRHCESDLGKQDPWSLSSKAPRQKRKSRSESDGDLRVENVDIAVRTELRREGLKPMYEYLRRSTCRRSCLYMHLESSSRVPYYLPKVKAQHPGDYDCTHSI